VQTLAASGTSVFAGGQYYGIRRSTDNGTSWANVSMGVTNPYVQTLAVASTGLFAGTLAHGVIRSLDNGSHWTAVNAGLTSLDIRSLAVVGTTLFAGTAAGVFRSPDNGGNWTAVNSGFTGESVSSFAATSTTLFAGTLGSGVWRRPLSELIDIPLPPPVDSTAAAFSIGQNSPNPFHSETTIRYALPKKSSVSLTVFNTLGQQVAVFQYGDVTPGAYALKFNRNGLASGVYFYSIQADDVVLTKKMIILR
jgi:hypothetical protein